MSSETPIAAVGNGSKNCPRLALHTPQRPPGTLVPLRFSTNLRYLRIPSRFVPAIPTCGGFLYLLILTLDARGRLGLALKSSARRYRSPPGSPKRGLGRAPRCTPARGISLFASGGTRTCRTKTRLTGRAGVGVDRTTGLRPTRRRTFAAASRGSRRRLILAGIPHKTADVRN